MQLKLSKEARKMLAQQGDRLRDIVTRQTTFSGLGRANTDSNVVPFEEVVTEYNTTLSYDEIAAWVAYKRRIGVPMTHWRKYFIDLTKDNLDKLVEKGVLFYHDKEYLPLAIYTYSNIYDRLFQLEKDKDTIINKYSQAIYDKHKEVLEAAKPQMLYLANPDARERPIIKVISSIAKSFTISTIREEYLDIEKSQQIKYQSGKAKLKAKKELVKIRMEMGEEYSLQDVFINYLYSLNPKKDFESSSAAAIVDYYILGKNLVDSELSNEAKAEIKSHARIEGEKLFAKFLHEVITYEDQQKLEVLWNRQYNGFSEMNYTKVPIGFECSRKFKSGVLKITPIQRQGVAFMEAMGSGINAFDVGVGKTMTAIINLAHQMYAGKCKRPLIVVPKPTYKKWVREIEGYTASDGTFVHGVLSHTGIKVNAWGNLGKNFIKDKDFRKSVDANSITVVTYEGFKKIGLGKEVEEDVFYELVNILAQRESSKSHRDTEIDYQKYRQMIGVGQKGTIMDIDVVGFDYVVIDEAHRCKNVFENVASEKDEEGGKGKKRYSMTSSVSETGQKAFLLLNYLQTKFGDNVMLLTATPFTNSPLEIYSMLSLVAYKTLKWNGVENVKTFFDLFVLPQTEWVSNYKEEIVEKEVVKSFSNRLILQRFIHNHILYKTGEEAGVKRPRKINLPLVYDWNEQGKRLPKEKQVLTYLKQTNFQRDNQDEILVDLQSATHKKLDKALLFRAFAKSLDNALSPYLVKDFDENDDKSDNDNSPNYVRFVEDSPKIFYTIKCIQSVKKWHEARNESVSGQVIYANRGKRFFDLIKEYLHEVIGYKRQVIWGKFRFSEVEVISSDISDRKKEAVKEAFLAGIVKIIIGTATIREGIDLQNKGTVIYNLYPEWNPTDIRQLEGRIWRQGNEFSNVRIVMPLVTDTMDVFVFQKLEEKTARINDIWYKADRGNVLDLESIDPNEIKLALITDPKRIAYLMLDEETKKLKKKLVIIEEEISNIKESNVNIENFKHYRNLMLDWLTSMNTISLRAVEKAKENVLLEIKQEVSKARTLTKELLESEWFIKKVEARLKDDSYYKSVSKIYERVQELSSSSTIDEKKLLRLAKDAHSISSSFAVSSILGYSYWWLLDRFSDALSIVRKVEKTILIPRGYNLDSDLNEVVEAATKDADIIQAELDAYKDTKGQYSLDSIGGEALLAKVIDGKARLNIEGLSPNERAKEFESLNYLLAEKAFIPPKEEADEVDFDDDEESAEHEQEDNDLLLLAQAQAAALRLKQKQFEFEQINR